MADLSAAVPGVPSGSRRASVQSRELAAAWNDTPQATVTPAQEHSQDADRRVVGQISGRPPVQRLGDRRRVNEPASLRLLVKKRFGKAQEVDVPVVIVDISVTGAALQVPDDLDVAIRQMFGLGIRDMWSNVRCVWVRRGANNAQYCGVIFIDPYPPFLPMVHEWLGRDKALNEHIRD
jgi:hypothetical protein